MFDIFLETHSVRRESFGGNYSKDRRDGTRDRLPHQSRCTCMILTLSQCVRSDFHSVAISLQSSFGLTYLDQWFMAWDFILLSATFCI